MVKEERESGAGGFFGANDRATFGIGKEKEPALSLS